MLENAASNVLYDEFLTSNIHLSQGLLPKHHSPLYYVIKKGKEANKFPDKPITNPCAIQKRRWLSSLLPPPPHHYHSHNQHPTSMSCFSQSSCLPLLQHYFAINLMAKKAYIIMWMESIIYSTPHCTTYV